jgi:hypothetical protein
MLGFYQNAIEQLESIEDCLNKDRVLSSLCLLYSLIDVTASLERGPNEGKSAFVRWVDRYMLRKRPLPCTALELYAARCGILHSFTPDSNLSRKGKARNIVYAFGPAKLEDLAKTGKRLGRADASVHIKDLVESFRAGLDEYLGEIVHDPERLRMIEQSESLWFTRLDRATVARFLRLTDT